MGGADISSFDTGVPVELRRTKDISRRGEIARALDSFSDGWSLLTHSYTNKLSKAIKFEMLKEQSRKRTRCVFDHGPHELLLRPAYSYTTQRRRLRSSSMMSYLGPFL